MLQPSSSTSSRARVEVELVVVVELRADRLLDHRHVGGRVLGRQVDRVDHALDVGEGQVPDLEKRTDQPEPVDVRVVVLRLRGAGRPARVQKPGPEVELDGPHRKSGEFTELADPHGGVPLTAVHPPGSGKHRSPCTRSVSRMANPDGRFLRSGPSGSRRHGTLVSCVTPAPSFPSAPGPRPGAQPLVPTGGFFVARPVRPVRHRSEFAMDLQGSFHVYDTTLRDGAQQEGLNLSVADKLAIARQLDELGVGYIEGGWPGANPRDTEFFRRAARGPRPAAREAGRLRRHPPGRRTGRRRPAGRGAARQRRLGGDAGREVARPARRAGAADHAGGEPRDGPRHRARTCAPRGSRSSSTRSTSSTATATTATTRSRCCARPPRPAPRWSRCATPTAGCCPAGSPTWSTTSSTPPASGSASTATTTPAARSPTRSPRSTPAPPTCRARSTGTASGPATPTWSPWSPTSSSSWTGGCCRPGCSPRPPGSPTRSPR